MIPARSHPTSVAAAPASIAAARKNFRRLRGTSQRIRSRGRLSREQNGHSVRVLKLEGLILEHASVHQMRSTGEHLRLPLQVAKSGIWHRDDVA